jgi:hypothetical protein
MYAQDMENAHQKQLQIERELSGRIIEDLNRFRQERSELVEGQHQLELRVEEMMNERDRCRNELRKLQWELKQSK